MRIKTAVLAGCGLIMLGEAPALAEGARIYAYPSKENYCPAGLQPVTISGAICCGTPNQSVSYQHMMAHPVRKRQATRRVTPVQVDCPIGTKGCTYD